MDLKQSNLKLSGQKTYSVTLCQLIGFMSFKTDELFLIIMWPCDLNTSNNFLDVSTSTWTYVL